MSSLDLNQLKSIVENASSGYALLDLFTTEILPHAKLEKSDKDIVSKAIDRVFLIDRIRKKVIDNNDYYINNKPFVLSPVNNSVFPFEIKHDIGVSIRIANDHTIHVNGFTSRFNNGNANKTFTSNTIGLDGTIKIAIREMQQARIRWKNHCSYCNTSFDDSIELLQHINSTTSNIWCDQLQKKNFISGIFPSINLNKNEGWSF